LPTPARKLVLTNHQAPGDIVMLTAALRDLHRSYPGIFTTDVRTSCADLWDFNPWLTPLEEADPSVDVIRCEYPLIQRSNQAPYHFIHGFIQNLNQQLGLRIVPTEFKGDIHLSDAETSWMSQIQELAGDDAPFWIVAAGGKYDFTIKWWGIRRFQEVVDAFRGRVRFVQVGDREHHHPPLSGVIDLRGKTSLRQLVRLVYHASGVLTPVSLLMHLAAAVPVPPDRPGSRPCVVIAGGREPPHWEAYPSHQYLHTIGALPCCETGGCWRARTMPLGDGDQKDHPNSLCINVVGALPKCMHLITARQVAERIALYLQHPAYAVA